VEVEVVGDDVLLVAHQKPHHELHRDRFLAGTRPYNARPWPTVGPQRQACAS
jgi:hypothetical protein